MTFSDWITIVSILLGVLLAVFKYDEFEIIKLKSFKNFIPIPVILLILSGVSAYFNSNEYPECLSVFWFNCGIPSGLWSIIWMIAFVFSVSFFWKKFTNHKPSEELINKYIDYLDTLDTSKFLTFFRKYERNFFKPKGYEIWKDYSPLIELKEWWDIAPIETYREVKKFHHIDLEISITLLESQLNRLPDSPLSKELESEVWDDLYINDRTPILQIYLSKKEVAEKFINQYNIITTVNASAESYFSSEKFKIKDKVILSFEPSDTSHQCEIPHKLIPFYLIEFINRYWMGIFSLKFIDVGFFSYYTWAKHLLQQMPDIEEEPSTESPNLYLFAIERMLSNIHEWVRYLTRKSGFNEFSESANGFTLLKGMILKDLNNVTPQKVPKEWLNGKAEIAFKDMIVCRNYFGENYYPNLDSYSSLDVRQVFDKVTDTYYFLPKAKENEGYKWLKSKLKL